jgi:hypothetical protein
LYAMWKYRFWRRRRIQCLYYRLFTLPIIELPLWNCRVNSKIQFMKWRSIFFRALLHIYHYCCIYPQPELKCHQWEQRQASSWKKIRLTLRSIGPQIQRGIRFTGKKATYEINCSRKLI